MKKLFISTSIAAALTLVGCGGGETIEDLRVETPSQSPVSRILFDPANGDLNIPNDLLMLPGDDGFFDYTLNIPVADPSNYGDPQNALNVLDGWSTTQPFVIDVVTPPGVSLDASTLAAGVRIFEATLGLDQRDPDCAQVTTPSAGCKLGDELQFGQDFVLSLADSNTITVVPLKPLKAAQGHMLVMTTALKDSSGKSVQGSTTWDLVRQDIQTMPLASPSQLELQGLVNSFVNPLLGAGMQRDEITYVSTFMTQSTMTVPNTIKQLMIGEFAQRAAMGDPTAGQALPAIVATDVTAAPTAMEALGLVSAEAVTGAVQFGIANLPAEAAALVPAIEAADFSGMTTCAGLLGAVTGNFGNAIPQVNEFAANVAVGILGQGAGPFCAAKRAQATISLPHYLAIPTAENPMAPINEFMTSACDSGIVIAGAGDAVAGLTTGPNHALCSAVGLGDYQLPNGANLDRDRHLTRFNPVPLAKGPNAGNATLDVQITIPDPVAAGALGFAISEPENGWPVAILYHGITRQKEDMLGISGALSLAGIATVAIDQPLHGSRGYDLNDDGIDEINATTVSATVFMNLASLPTARSNLWQAVSDLLGVRLGLNAVADTTASGMVNLDATNVSVMGVSLGAIGGGNFAAVANTSMGGDLAALDGMFAIQAASLESPGAGIANFLLESVAFGNLIKGLLLGQSSVDFQNFVVATNGLDSYAQATDEMNAAAVPTFMAALTDAQLAEVNGTFNEFAFAAQSMMDAADPINYVSTLATNTATHVMTVVGDGSEVNLSDQVIPVATALPLSGQDAYVEQAGFGQVSSTVISDTPISGYMLFNEGAHGSSLSPTASAAVTAEMQSQIANFLASGGRVALVTNTDVVN